ncbi:MAG: hypothetical protein WAU48_15210 [Gammaproteobacteria bacterium]
MKPIPPGRTALLLCALLTGGMARAEDSAAPAAVASPAATALNLDATAIRGNQELPKVMYIVPWKDAAMAELAGRPVNSLVEEILAPVDREVFRRQTRYFHQLYDAEPPPAR